MLYEEIPDLTREELLECFAGSDERAIVYALYSAALYDEEDRWVEQQCLHFLDAASLNIRHAALGGLMHLVRLHGRLSLDLVNEKLKEADLEPELAGQVEDLRGEIQHYIFFTWWRWYCSVKSHATPLSYERYGKRRRAQRDSEGTLLPFELAESKVLPGDACHSAQSQPGAQVMTSVDPQTFWNWFVANQSRYRVFEEAEQQPLIQEFRQQLHQYHSGLEFELGVPYRGVAEVVVTASGDVELFPAVMALVDAAPKIDGWEVVALRQPLGFHVNDDFGTIEYVEFLGIECNLVDCLFTGIVWDESPGQLRIHVVFPNYCEVQAAAFEQVALVAIQTILGEVIAAAKIDCASAGLMPTDPESLNDYLPLTELDHYLRWFHDDELTEEQRLKGWQRRGETD